AGGEEPHEPREADELGAALAQRRVERGIEGGAIGIVAMRDDAARNPRPRRDGEAACILPVRDDADDLGGEAGGGAGFDERLHVGAAPGDEDRRPQPGHRPAMLRMTTPGPSPRRARRPMRWTVSPASASSVATLSAASGAQMATMPMPQLKVRAISCGATPPA